MNESQKSVECPEHGVRDAAFVCQHLLSGLGSGFHCGHDDDNPDQLWPDAWCDACERMRRSEGGWTDRSEDFASVRLLCDGCYQRVRGRNWKEDQEAFSKLVADAVAYLQDRQDELKARYNLGAYPRYDWNQETGQLIFSDEGVARVVADIQFVGSVSRRSNTWLWSWANRSNLEPVRQRVREVRAFGEKYGYLKLACACWPAEEADGWEMAAVTAYLLGAAGAYRSPDDGRLTFLVMTAVHWAQ